MPVDPFRRLAAQGAMIERLTSDSRRCAPGVAFFAYPGERADGRAHIDDAIARGAAAVLWEERGFDWRREWRVPNAPVADLKQSASALAGEFHGHPSEQLWVCGVTGTNGKTSCSQWLGALLKKAAVIGTLGAGFTGRLYPGVNTTPDALETQLLLKRFLAEGAQAVAMEVSSHGLAQGRVNGVRFRCALFTNLTHEHLDYHGSMQAYGEAKARLFEMPGLETAVLNLDDPFGVELARRLREKTRARVRTIGYSLEKRDAPVDQAIVLDPRVRINAVGRFNASNALGVLGCLMAHGMPYEKGVKLLETLPPVPGRMQTVGDAPLVLVDYAHTPDALQSVLQALRPVARARGGKLTVVFGAGGERDAAKRPLMGAVAARLADRALVTSDNPRGEDPAAIIAQIGLADAEPDRARAIEKAVLEADAKDVILIAGKGHEDYQEVAGKRLPFSDAAQAIAALRRRA